MTITGGSALSKDEIDKMIHDAEQYAEEDRKRREAVELRNSADGAVYSTEKFLSDNADKIPAELKAEVEADIADVKRALEGEDQEAISAAAAKLAASSQKMGTAMYEAAGAAEAATEAGGGTTSSAGGSTDDDVVDAEIVDEGNDTPASGASTSTGSEDEAK
jgi:molecular chaperone DnaK